MIAMFLVGGVLAVAFVVALVVAEFADRRRSITIQNDRTRSAPAALNPKLPWN